MSEHMSITANIEFNHMAYEEEGSFSYCHRCKTILRRLKLELNQGITGEWIRAECPKCKKTVWVATLGYETIEDKIPKEWKQQGDEGRVLIKDNQKCAHCKKPTNHYDAWCISGKIGKKGLNYYCSEKCYYGDEIKDKKVKKK